MGEMTYQFGLCSRKILDIVNTNWWKVSFDSYNTGRNKTSFKSGFHLGSVAEKPKKLCQDNSQCLLCSHFADQTVFDSIIFVRRACIRNKLVPLVRRWNSTPPLSRQVYPKTFGITLIIKYYERCLPSPFEISCYPLSMLLQLSALTQSPRTVSYILVRQPSAWVSEVWIRPKVSLQQA